MKFFPTVQLSAVIILSALLSQVYGWPSFWQQAHGVHIHLSWSSVIEAHEKKCSLWFKSSAERSRQLLFDLRKIMIGKASLPCLAAATWCCVSVFF